MFAPGLRLGWIAATPAIVEQLALVKQRSDPHTQNLVQEAVAAPLGDGSFDRHLATLRVDHAARAVAVDDACRQRLPAGTLRLSRPAGRVVRIYVKRLADIDVNVLAEMIRESVADLRRRYG